MEKLFVTCIVLLIVIVGLLAVAYSKLKKENANLEIALENAKQDLEVSNRMCTIAEHQLEIAEATIANLTQPATVEEQQKPRKRRKKASAEAVTE